MVTPGTWEWFAALALGRYWLVIETVLIFAAFITWRSLRPNATAVWPRDVLFALQAVILGGLIAWGPGYAAVKAIRTAFGWYDGLPFMALVTIDLALIDAVLLAGVVWLVSPSADRPPRAAP